MVCIVYEALKYLLNACAANLFDFVNLKNPFPPNLPKKKKNLILENLKICKVLSPNPYNVYQRIYTLLLCGDIEMCNSCDVITECPAD